MYIPVTEAEDSLIGALLISPELLDIALTEDVSPDSFSREDSKAAFQAMLDVRRNGQSVDLISLIQKLGESSKVYLYQCTQMTPRSSIETVRTYAALVREECRRRYADNAVSELQFMLSEREPIQDIQQKAHKLAAVMTDTQTADECTIQEGVASFFARLNKAKQYIKTGYRHLDTKTFVEPGDYAIIGGRPSSGKTAFALSLIQKMAQQYRVVFFSLETSAEKIMDRLMTASAGLSFDKVKNCCLSSEEQIKAARMADTVYKLNLTVVNASGKSVAWIQAKAMKLKADVIFIDYLGLIKSPGKSRYEQVTNTSIDLHVMAQQTKTTVFALSQLNRAGNGVPTMEDLRESGQLEQDADLIILLHNDKENERYSVIVAKNKEGETGVIPFKFYGETQNFAEIDYVH